MVRLLVFVLVLTAIAGIAAASGPTALRTWHDTQGRSFHGRAIAYDGANVEFEGADGSRITVAIDKLTSQDQKIIEEHFAVAGGDGVDIGELEGTEEDGDTSAPAIVLVMVVVGYIIVGIGGIWFLVVAFRESVAWGLGCMFVPFVSLIFLISHQDDAKKPFALELLGVAIAIGGPLLLAGLLSQRLRGFTESERVHR